MPPKFRNPALAAAVCALSFWAIDQNALPGGMYFLQALLAVSVVVVIALGAEWLVDSACRIAQLFGVSHLVIGLTVVAFGTSAPEMAASLLAGFQGNGDITVANVVGSNVFNICFILGGVALILKPGLETDTALVRRDGPALLSATVLLFLFVGGLPGSEPPQQEGPTLMPQLLNLRLERGEGFILLALLVSYLVLLYRGGEPGGSGAEEQKLKEMEIFGHATWRDGPMFLLGLVAVVGGCQLLVGTVSEVDGRIAGYGALWFARIWDVPDYVVGVTVIAAGTSAPELVVSFVAATRGAFGLSAGNLIGSDIFNMLGVVGLAGTVLQPPWAPTVTLSPSVIPGLAALSVVVLMTIIFMRTGWRISRREGLILVLVGVVRWTADFAFRGQF